MVQARINDHSNGNFLDNFNNSLLNLQSIVNTNEEKARLLILIKLIYYKL